MTDADNAAMAHAPGDPSDMCSVWRPNFDNYIV